MGYARYIGRIGALAVTLGVGVAIANTPGLAFADTGSSTSGDSSTSSSSTGSSGTGSSGTGSSGTTGTSVGSSTTSPGNGTSTTAGSTGNQSTASTPESSNPGSPPDSEEHSDVTSAEDAEIGTDADEDSQNGGDDEAAANAGDEGDEGEAPLPSAEENASPVETPAQDDDSVQQSANHESSLQDPSGGSQNVQSLSAFSNNVESTIDDGQFTESTPQPLQTFSISVNDDPADASVFARTFTTTEASTRTTAITTSAVEPKPTWVGVVTDFIDAVLRSMQNPADGSPVNAPVLTAALFLVRNELERSLVPRTANAATQQGVTQLEDPPAPVVATETHVLVIGIDGANLSRILADPENENFRALMLTSTTGPGSIVGHTTISNPSWTAILTGNWGEQTGVINNVFTPWTYDKFPTVFNQIERLEVGDEDIVTMAIGNWDVINAIAGAGSDPADHNIFVGHQANDPHWEASDDLVADLTIDAISGADGTNPNFILSYYVGVDENGHAYGGGSEAYKLALQNMDDNLGDIMQAIEDSGEEWTVIVVTDHGHQTVKGFGHGFQSPNETETFVIAHGSDFKPGYINTKYEIVDTTPTVVKLFGGTPRSNADGTPLMDLDGSSFEPQGDLFAAIGQEIAKNRYPDALTNMALSVRTLFATIPYVIYTTGHEIAQSMPSFLVVPVQLVMDVLYVVTNIPAQIVAQLTGVGGASIFPILPPPRPNFEPVDPPTLLLVNCGAPGAASASSCGDAIVA